MLRARCCGVNTSGKIFDFNCNDNNSLFSIFETLSDRKDAKVPKFLSSRNPAKHNVNTSLATVGGTGFGTKSIANNVVSNKI